MIQRFTGRHLPRGVAAGAACIAAFLVSTTLGAASKAKFTSEWAATPITVDGANTEWPTLLSFAKDIRISIAVRNDEQNLYVALITSDTTTALQVLRDGLIVWLDAEGGSKKRFGIKYPVSAEPGPPPNAGQGRDGAGSGQRGRPDGSGGQEGDGARGYGMPGGQPRDAEGMWKQALSDGRLKRAELLGPGKDDVRVLMLEVSTSIRARLGRSDGMLIYELAVPLGNTQELPDGLGVRPGAIVGIGLETPERNTSMRGPGGGRGGSGGGRGGGMGGSGGGRGGRMGGSGGGRGGGMGGPGGGMGGPGGAFGQQQKALKAWTSVQLATPPTSR